MKIEMGESLFYSWLRHVKECQIVQTNWKPSPQWQWMNNEGQLQTIYDDVQATFSKRYPSYRIFKCDTLSQSLSQSECDVLGICLQNGENHFYTVDVAFHENGLSYGDKDTTVSKVISKLVRTALCLLGYFDTKEADLYFASPKINPNVLNPLKDSLATLDEIISALGYSFKFHLIEGTSFHTDVLKPILNISRNVADTSELFLRAYQLYDMFDDKKDIIDPSPVGGSTVNEMLRPYKIGILARFILRPMLELGNLSENEVELLQTANYCKRAFDLQFPALVKTDSPHEKVRYYSNPLHIRGKSYKLCSQWYEGVNDDRTPLIHWFEKHRSDFDLVWARFNKRNY